MSRVYNFNPGPATLPQAVLEHAQHELLDYQGTGMSVMELSHRAPHFEAINTQAEERIKRLLGLDADYRVLFLQGGASLQFAMLPLNFLQPDSQGNYILTGSWSEKALKEAAQLGSTHEAASSKPQNYAAIPADTDIVLSDNPAYVHITSNNTITGTQWHRTPDVGAVPLVADASSDFLSRPIEAERFALIYAGAQKNAGPSGVTIVVLRQSWLEQAAERIPIILRYATHAKANSLYNTPPTFGIYLVNLVAGWVEAQGGLSAIAALNAQKAGLIYGTADESGGFYRSTVETASRSLMNATLRLPSAELEAQFIRQAAEAGMIGLKGHRSVGGVRVSMYNALPLEACQALANFMREFARSHG